MDWYPIQDHPGIYHDPDWDKALSEDEESSCENAQKTPYHEKETRKMNVVTERVKTINIMEDGRKLFWSLLGWIGKQVNNNKKKKNRRIYTLSYVPLCK